ncbi:hypothetical protein BDV06DRAFT_210987 [Aspergillus oleicola]
MFNPNADLNNPWRYNQPPTQPQRPIVIDSESEDDEGEQPGMASSSRIATGPHPSHTRQPTYPMEQEKRIRSRLREERHAALCVLMDRELLTIQALAAQETLPQTRRRFLSNLLSPSDPTTAASIRSDQFTIQQPSTSFSGYTEPIAVSRSVIDVCESDDSGWYKPSPSASASANTEDTLGDMRTRSPSASASVSAASSPASGGRFKGRTAGTPERNRAAEGTEEKVEWGGEAGLWGGSFILRLLVALMKRDAGSRIETSIAILAYMFRPFRRTINQTAG